MQLSAVTREQFATKAWKRPAGYPSAAKSNILPVVEVELARLVPTMPLGFVKTADAFELVAITALQPGTNCFVAADGNWIGAYIPAAVRAYPFHLVKPQDRDEKVLCFDNSEGLLCDVGQGEPFFDGDVLGKATQEMLNLLSGTETSRVVTQRLVDVLQATELIQPWALKLQQGEQTMPVEGLYRIDEAALNALPDDAFLSLRKAGALPLAYAQLFSMNQLAMLPKAARMQAQIKGQLEAKAPSQTPLLSDFDFLLSEEATFKFT
jgi:SapC